MVLWIIAAVLLAFWLLGFALKVTTGLIHILLALAVILFVLGFFRGRHSTAAP